MDEDGLDTVMIDIVVAGHAGTGINSLASYLAIVLDREGFDVVVNSHDEIKPEFAAKEKLQKIKNNVIVAVRAEQLPREVRFYGDTDETV